MNAGHVAPYHLTLTRQGELKEAHGRPFDTKAYSRMKYGVHSDLKHFASVLARELLTSAPQLYTSDQPPAFLTSYRAAAPPATSMAQYCLDVINIARFKSGLQPGEMVRVYRPHDYIEEYATLSADERKKHMDNQEPNTLQGRDLAPYLPVIIDDIHVTGNYTAMMRQAILPHHEALTAHLIVCDDSIRRTANAEHLLNTSEIGKPSDLLPYIANNDFVFTRRFLKMLLRSTDEEVKTVVAAIPDRLLEDITRAIINTGSELGDIFPDTCALILDTAERMGIIG